MSEPAPDAGRGRYSDAVRRLFFALEHAGELGGADGTIVCAAAFEGGAGARILLQGAIENGRWQRLRYRVFGCPQLLAAAEAACARFEGRPLDAAASFPLQELAAALEIPVEKTGRLLLLEDAFRELAARARRRA